ncbi:AtzE family amidohydrolase [Candidatus Pantoea carbekii]|uniref:GatA protein n=1 Tax=Candidatus Pantoea carbekii TaxID=1235990 RepID=U3U709_9GAMM|nr:AtzE family amidohydrolase [Candidatus Pantoea carbekii]AKC32254.1 glutamyl-tRNA (Gln) amidotransferase subunit A [Candidatus Pantoea carbekii]BAO00790.1 GatA protein [Candidatus Pantoea carbekii]
MNLTALSIHSLQKLLQKGEVSAYEIAQYTLKAITQYNPIINAWTEITDQRMLHEANEIDRKRKLGYILPLLSGIPYGVKNLFDIAGYSTLAGAHLFSHRPAAQNDAWLVNRLRESGALLTGMLNMDAYAYGFTTENTYYGTTRNPRDLTRIAGGSSGGSAAAVAAGLVHFSLGSDTNGSIRVPASLCGIFGLKPTFGRLSRTGTHPFVPSLDHIGLFARSVEDLTQVYDVIQGTDNNDKFQISQKILLVSNILNKTITGIHSAVLGGFFSSYCTTQARIAVDTVAKALNAIDEKIILPDADIARSAAFIITAAESGNHYLPALRETPECFEPNSRDRLLAGAILPSAWYIQAQRFRRYFQKQVLPLFQKFELLIAPATPCSATPIGQQTIDINGENFLTRVSMGMLTQPISFLGLPVCTVPLPTTNGLPIGVQLISAPFKEEIVLQAAWMLQQNGVTLPQTTLMDNKNDI